MRAFITLLLGIICLSSCTKVIIDKIYEKKLYGSWNIRQIQNLNGSTNYSLLNFRAGTLTFNENGSFRFADANADVYDGNWSINTIRQPGNCYTAPDGTSYCPDDYNTTVTVNSTCNTNQQTKAAYFESLSFAGSDVLFAYVNINGLIFYKYTFDRKH